MWSQAIIIILIIYAILNCQCTSYGVDMREMEWLALAGSMEWELGNRAAVNVEIDVANLIQTEKTGWYTTCCMSEQRHRLTLDTGYHAE